jgi:hypothetical protein
MTLQMAEQGGLVDAILSAITAEPPKTLERAALDQIILDGLNSRLEMRAEDLPVSADQARLALAVFTEGRRKLALKLGLGGESVTWANRDWVERARGLRTAFRTSEAVTLFAEMLEVDDVRIEPGPDASSADVRAPPVQPFATMLHVIANSAPLSDQSAREIGQHSIEHAPGSPVAVYLTARPLDAGQIPTHRKSQIFLPTNILVLSPAAWREWRDSGARSSAYGGAARAIRFLARPR